MPSMKTTIDAFQLAGLRDKVKIIQAALVTQRYAEAIGADGYSEKCRERRGPGAQNWCGHDGQRAHSHNCV